MKTRCRYSIIIVSAAVLACCIPRPGIADNAAVLPTGISQAYWDLYHYLPTRQRYNADGDREDLAYPFTDAALDSSVLTSLAPLDPLVGGTANIGRVSVNYEYDIDVLDLGYSYGLTDKLSLGIHIPYYWIKNNVNTSLDTTNANVGLNPATAGEVMRIPMPMLTEDTRKGFTRQAKQEAESARVSVRNARRDAMAMLKDLVKEKEISEDEERRGQDNVQKLTDSFVTQIEKLLAEKEADLMEI